MSDLRDLYQEVILDHGRHPRNHQRPENANRQAAGYNPLCGDRVTVFVRVEAGVVRAVGFEGSGCAISTASGSMMTEALTGKSEAEARALYAAFHDAMTGKPAAAGAVPLGKLEVFHGVREFPIRVKCATLAWHTLRAALDGAGQPVSTE